MKQKTLISIVLTTSFILSLCSMNVYGQLYKKGDKDLNFTIGYGDLRVINNSCFNSGLPPIAVSYDFGFKDDLGPGVLSLGAVVAGTTYSDERTDSITSEDYGQKSTTLVFALRSTYHYKLVEKLDTYAGVHIGARFENWKAYGLDPDQSEDQGREIRPVINLFGGVKYYITDNIFLLGELGYGIAFVNFGIGMKM